MSETASTTSTTEETRVAAALDALLGDNDPKQMSYEDFRGAQFDHGLAWVYFDEGYGGLDVSPVLQKQVDGDSWIVNGQKVWNTLAHLGDRGMLVTRTDPEMPKHRGMTYFAVDMKSPGVDVQPLRQITGEAEFNEVFLTDVEIPEADRIGDIGDGWRVSLTTLMNERNAIGAGTGGGPPKAGSGPVSILTNMWRDTPEGLRSDVTRDRMMQVRTAKKAIQDQRCP